MKYNGIKLAVALSSILLLTGCKNANTLQSTEDTTSKYIETNIVESITTTGDIIEDMDSINTNNCTILTLSEDTLDEYTAQLIIDSIYSIPSEELNAYKAKGVWFQVTDNDGHMYTTMPPVVELQEIDKCGIWADCIENAVKLYEIELNGEKKYLLRGYVSYGTENGTYSDANPELYRARFYAVNFDEPSDEKFGAWYSSVDNLDEVYFEISDSLIYKGGNILYDEKQQVELIFDPENFTVEIVSVK